MTAKRNHIPRPDPGLMILSQAVAPIALALSLAACTQQPGARDVPQVEGPAGKLLATVNGYPLTEYDVRLTLDIRNPKVELQPESVSNALKELALTEMKYREAVKLELDKDPAYQKRLAEVMAYVNHFQRSELSRLFNRHISAKAVVSDEEARKYFDANRQTIQTELHIRHIFFKNAEEAEAALKKINGGVPFEKVAMAHFPKLAKGQTPWDLHLHWNEIPETWRDVMSRMKKGGDSVMIREPGGQSRIVKLVDSRIDPGINFENQKGAIASLLNLRKLKELTETTDEALRKKVRIVYQGK